MSSAVSNSRAADIADLALLAFGALDEEGDGDAGLDAENVVFGAGELGIGAHVAAEIDHVNLGEFLRKNLAEPVESAAFDEASIGDEGDDPSSASRSEAQR